MPTPDKIDQLYDALKADGAVQKSRENFRAYMSDANNRQTLYNALKADGAVNSPTFEEFENRLGIVPAPQQPVTPTMAPMPRWVKPGTETSAMPEDVRQRFEQQDKVKQQQAQAEERARAQRTAMGSPEIGFSAQAMAKKQEEERQERQRQMHDNPTHTLTEEQHSGAHPGDPGAFANPMDFSPEAQAEVNERVARKEVEKAAQRTKPNSGSVVAEISCGISTLKVVGPSGSVFPWRVMA